MKKKLAIQLFGHLRTFNTTSKSLFDNVIIPNFDSGYDVDIFIHTWSKLDIYTYHNFNANIKNKDISKEDILLISKLYNPKKITIDIQQDGEGGLDSIKRGCDLRESYEKENNIKYDYIIYTRPDILFLSPLKIDDYISSYLNNPELKNINLPDNHIFCAHNMFTRMNVADPRYINESDLIWFCKFNTKTPLLEKDSVIIPINYKLYKDFIIQRSDNIYLRPATPPHITKHIY